MVQHLRTHVIVRFIINRWLIALSHLIQWAVLGGASSFGLPAAVPLQTRNVYTDGFVLHKVKTERVFFCRNDSACDWQSQWTNPSSTWNSFKRLFQSHRFLTMTLIKIFGECYSKSSQIKVCRTTLTQFTSDFNGDCALATSAINSPVRIYSPYISKWSTR